MEMDLVLREDGRCRKALFWFVSSEVFLTWYLDLGPACWTDADDPPGTDAFEDEICLEPKLYAAASQRGFAFELFDLKDRASASHVAHQVGVAETEELDN